MNLVIVELATGARHEIAGTTGVNLTSMTPVWDGDSARLFIAAASEFSGTDCRTGAHLSAAPDPNDTAAWQHALIEDAILRTLRIAVDAGSTADATLVTRTGAPAVLIEHDGRPALAITGGGFGDLTFVDPSTGEPLSLRATWMSTESGPVDVWFGDGRYRFTR